jgi:hypothetical protein
MSFPCVKDHDFKSGAVGECTKRGVRGRAGDECIEPGERDEQAFLATLGDGEQSVGRYLAGVEGRAWQTECGGGFLGGYAEFWECGLRRGDVHAIFGRDPVFDLERAFLRMEREPWERAVLGDRGAEVVE